MAKTALVVGASGIVGSATAALLVEHGWTVHGLARRPTGQADVHPVAADLQDAEATKTALSGIDPDAVFIATWLRQDSEAENIGVNSAMVRNLLDGLPKPMRFSIWTGLAAHRPLGNINRARNETYRHSADFRARVNGCPYHEPVGGRA